MGGGSNRVERRKRSTEGCLVSCDCLNRQGLRTLVIWKDYIIKVGHMQFWVESETYWLWLGSEAQVVFVKLSFPLPRSCAVAVGRRGNFELGDLSAHHLHRLQTHFHHRGSLCLHSQSYPDYSTFGKDTVLRSGEKNKEKCLKNTSKHRICPASVCSIYGDSSVTFIGDWLTKVVCWCCTCPESSPSVKSESVDSSLVCIPRSPHPFKRITAPCIHFHTT